MEIIRVRTPELVEQMEPHLTFHDPRHKGIFLEDLLQRMSMAPDSLLILAGMDEDGLRAFAIVTNPGVAYPYVYLSQIWSHPNNATHDWYTPFFARVVLWAAAHDKDYIRAETQRNTEALYRKFGFESFSTNVRLDLDESGIKELFNQRPEELLQWASLNQTPVKNQDSTTTSPKSPPGLETPCQNCMEV
jgi:hypothetical protein